MDAWELQNRMEAYIRAAEPEETVHERHPLVRALEKFPEASKKAPEEYWKKLV